MKVIFYHSKKKLNKRGEAPIYCRITVDGSREDFSTGIFIQYGCWINGCVIGESSELYNATFAKMRMEIMEAYLLLQIKAKHITATVVKQKYLNVDIPRDLMDVADMYIEERKKNSSLKKGTLTKDSNYYGQLADYLMYRKTKDVAIGEINNGWGFSYINYLRTVKCYGFNHIAKSVGFLKQVITFAVLKDYITCNPILLLPIKRNRPGPIIALSEQELSAWKAWKFASKRLQQVADLYLLQCSTGFSYMDIYQFNKPAHLVKHKGLEFIVKERGKNGRLQIVPLFAEARRLLKKYRDGPPVISNQKYNAYLKEIADILGIEKKLTTHTARKTFGSLILNKGWSIESVARMLGHANTSVTQSTYAQIGLSGVYNEMVRNAA